MNLCDYYVEEVLSDISLQQGQGMSWYEVEVSFYYDNDELKTCKLTSIDMGKLTEVAKGYKFQR